MKPFAWAKLAYSAVLSLTALCSGFAQSGPTPNAPTGLTQVSAGLIQFPATYWFVSSFDGVRSRFGPPLPWNPFGANTNVPIYYWTSHGNSYVVDDTVLPEEEREQWFREHSGETELTASSQSFSMESQDSGKTMSGDSLYADYGTNLWLEIPGASDGVANVILHNVTQGEVYELMSALSLLATRWYPEQALFTVSNQDWIATTVPMLDRTNSLFFWARDWTGIDENSNSIADWQEWTNYGPPVAFSQSLHTMTNTPLNIFLQASDPENLPLTYVFLGGPTNGALSGTPPNLVYTPGTNYDGPDGFAFQVTDGAFWSQPATITISVDTAIDFFIASAPRYSSNALVPVQLCVTSGVPREMALLIDSTNFAAAAWQTYSSSNIMVNAGSAEGWHELWIGLRGSADASPQVWRWTKFKLDWSRPELIITNPVASVISRPVIQLQGYCLEPLASMSFDLTNAAGVFTNQPVLLMDRWFDTNLWEFTTNTFQAFDVPLTNGLNTLTLRATDLAGNTTNQVLNLTLDYSGKTNPPVVRVYWPQDGTQVASTSNYTCRGWVDDFTATVTANVTDANGNVSPFNALVERDGKFWIQNLDLSSGTNIIHITVQDAAGNSSPTNVTVVASSLQFSVDGYDASAFSPAMPTTYVWGSIDSTNYAVWVNGVPAQLDGYGGWLATNAPVTSGGTYLFQARAIPSTESGGNGSGSGSFAADNSNLGNPASSEAVDAELQEDKPSMLYLASYNYSRKETSFISRQQSCGSERALVFILQDNDSWNNSVQYLDSAQTRYSQISTGDHLYYEPGNQGQTNQTSGQCDYEYLWNNWDYYRLDGGTLASVTSICTDTGTNTSSTDLDKPLASRFCDERPLPTRKAMYTTEANVIRISKRIRRSPNRSNTRPCFTPAANPLLAR